MEQTQTETHRLKTMALRRPRLEARWIFLAAAVLTVVLLALLPPLLSLNRYARRISTGIGASLGRPVHFDHVELHLLPLPGFTLTNFVVEEDPTFGGEPILRANLVRANLRVSSLWRRRIEVSRIRFEAPSINLVHDRSGKWNFEGILLQAAQIQTAPTAQRTAGSAPRFPYIEATGARFNLKEGVRKTPFSLSEADFALWQPDPQQWRMRLLARPIRTDTSVSDTGSLQLEASLGRAAALGSVPLDVQGSWRTVPLGEWSRLLFARDLGVRGELTLTAELHGSLSRNTVQTRLEINRLRRSDFVPDQTVSIDLRCSALATHAFRTVDDLRCSWPVPDSGGATLALAGSVPDVLQPSTADLQVGTARLPASILLTWLRVLSSRIPPTLAANGLLSGSISVEPPAQPDQPASVRHAGGSEPSSPAVSTWIAQATLPELSLSGSALGSTPLTLHDLFLHTAAPPSASPALLLSPLSLALGGRDPALLEAGGDLHGYTLHLTGSAVPGRLSAFAASVPQFGEGLSTVLPQLSSGDTSAQPAPGTVGTAVLRQSQLGGGPLPSGTATPLPSTAGTPIRLDLTAHRSWGGPQLWTDNLAPHGNLPPRHPPRHR